MKDYFDLYCQWLGEIHGIIEEMEADHICILGDFNAHPSTPFYDELMQFCQSRSLTISDTALLPLNSYIYMQYRLNNVKTSWLDHSITSQLLHQAIESCSILYDLGVSEDHIPLQITLTIANPPIFHPPLQRPPKNARPVPGWNEFVKDLHQHSRNAFFTLERKW